MNSDDSRDEICVAMRSLIQGAPHMRVGQLMAAAGELCADMHGRALWEADDAELLEAVWKLSRDLEQYTPAGAHESAG